MEFLTIINIISMQWTLNVYLADFLEAYHWTKNEISYNMFCFPKCDISYTYLAEDRATFHANEGKV